MENVMKYPTLTRRDTLLAATTFAAGAALGAEDIIATAQAQSVSSATAAQPVSAEDALIIAQEAYVYFYPLITMDVKVITAFNNRLPQV